MRQTFLAVATLLFSVGAFGQADTIENAAQKMLQLPDKLTIGSYGEVHYEQPVGNDIRQSGALDVHRLVLLAGYKFNNKASVITEIEFEHVKEVFVEQAYLNYDLGKGISAQAGLLLTPMGIINEYHEPTTFNGVNRPLIDNHVVPTTWREIGAGITGNFIQANSKVQLNVMNGFSSYNGSGKMGGKSGLRGGRQKAAESFSSSPNLATRYSYYGIKGLNVGLSGYFGKTSSTMFDGLDRNNAQLEARADSTVVGITMIGADVRYNYKALRLRGQLYSTGISNANEYNVFTGKDLGDRMYGYYAEVAYDVLKHASNTDLKLLPFLRYSYWDLHVRVGNSITTNDAYKNNALTTGLTLKVADGAAFKSDFQWVKSKADSKANKSFNLGVAYWF